MRDKIAREVISNILVHREYASAFPAKLIITKDELYAENWNRATTFGRLTPQNVTPYPKNPLIAKFFTQIGRADTLGSGVRNLYKFTKIYSNSEPVLEEGDIFKTTISLTQKEVSKNPVSFITESTNESKVLTFVKEKRVASAAEIQNALGFKSRTSVQRIITKLLSEGKILKSGTGKNTIYTAV